MRVEIYGDAKRKTVSGPTVQFTADDAAPVNDLKAQITPSIAGHSSVTITANGQNTSVSLTKPVYGGSVDVTTGVVTETHGGGAYNPTEVPTDLSSKIVSATTVKSASGSVASFNCTLGEYPMSALTAAINPVQDLNGYDNPWPAGAMGNLLPLSGNMTKTNNGVSATLENGIITLSGTASGNAIIVFDLETAISILPENYKIALFNSADNRSVFFRTQDGSTSLHNFACSSVNRVVTSWTAQGAEHTTAVGVQVSNGVNVDGMSLKPMVVPLIESDPSAFYPYSNICPISGWTEAKVTRAGKNLLNVSEWRDNFILNGVTITKQQDGSYKFNGICSGTTWIQFLSSGNNDIPISLPSGTYTLSANNNKVNVYIYRGTDFTNYVNGAGSVSSNNMPVTCIRFLIASGAAFNNEIVQFSIEPGSTATTYEPYIGTTYPVTWQSSAGTVYGGTLDVTQGKLTVDRAMVDLTTGMSGGTAGGGYVFYKAISNPKIVPNSKIAPIISEAYTTIRFNGVSGSANTIAVRDNGVLYVNTGSADIQPTGKAVYELSTPIEIQLDPVTISTISGQTNNVWADAGDVTVSYRDGLLSNVSGIMTNSTALTAGENITYTLSQERTFQIPGTVIRTAVGNNVMSASTGNISVTWSSHWFDITPWIAWQGLTFSRNDVDAPNAGRDMSGLMHRGRVGVKEKMNVQTVQLTRAQSSFLQTLLYPETIQVRVTPYPRTNAAQVMSMYTNNVKITYVIHRQNGEDLQSLSFPLIEN